MDKINKIITQIITERDQAKFYPYRHFRAFQLPLHERVLIVPNI